MLLLRVGLPYTDEEVGLHLFSWRFDITAAACFAFGLGLARGWMFSNGGHGHSVDIDIERQHEGFELQFLSIPTVVSL